jgi:hypothetical protein
MPRAFFRIFLLAALAMGAAWALGDPATTTPAKMSSLPAVDRLQTALSEIGLSDTQRAEVAAVVLSVRMKLATPIDR